MLSLHQFTGLYSRPITSIAPLQNFLMIILHYAPQKICFIYSHFLILETEARAFSQKFQGLYWLCKNWTKNRLSWFSQWAFFHAHLIITGYVEWPGYVVASYRAFRTWCKPALPHMTRKLNNPSMFLCISCKKHIPNMTHIQDTMCVFGLFLNSAERLHFYLTAVAVVFKVTQGNRIRRMTVCLTFVSHHVELFEQDNKSAARHTNTDINRSASIHSGMLSCSGTHTHTHTRTQWLFNFDL